LKHPNARPDWLEGSPLRRALWWYLAALLVFAGGVLLAARHYPGGYDWQYTVVSALASQKNNPSGSSWFAMALALSMLLLWQYLSTVKKALSATWQTDGYPFVALRLGVACGALVGVEKLLIHDVSSLVDKSHEFIALLTFLSLYLGILSLLLQLMRRQRVYALALIVVVVPMLAIGISDFWLYLAQRDVGWIGTRWQEMAIPLWLSFAFWQWLAVAFLWLGMGLLLLTLFGDAVRTVRLKRDIR
jgi:hypothetical protein